MLEYRKITNGTMKYFVCEVESYQFFSLDHYLASEIVFSTACTNSTGPSRPDCRKGMSFHGFPGVPETVMFVLQ